MMRAKDAPASFLVPGDFGRQEGYMIAEDADEQLDLFRKKISRQAKVQVLAMFALSDPGHLDKQQSAKISDIAEVMGYQRRDKTGRFHWQLYQDIEDTGLRLRRDQISLFISSPAGKTKDGRRKTRYEVIDMTLLQEFGFYYEDDDGQPIDLINPPRHKQKGLIPYSAPESDKPPIWAMPLVNDKGQLVLNKDGTTRRRPAGGVTWWWASRFVRMARAKKTNWVFYRNAVEKLRRYLADPATFDLMFMTLFWGKSDGQIEMAYKTLVRRLNIRSKDRKQIQKAIGRAFQNAVDEGVIDNLPTVREPGYYKQTKKTGRARRMSKVYQWKRSKTWAIGGQQIAILPEEPNS